MMKICLLTTSFPRRPDDFVGQWVLGLSRAMVEEGAQVTVVAPHDRDTAPQEIMDGVRVHRFSYWWPKGAQGLCYGAGIPTNIRLRKSLALQFPALEAAFMVAALRYGHNADVYNAHWTFAALPTVLISKLSRKPVIATAYSAEYIPNVLRPINRLVAHNSQAVISISQFTHDTVEKVAHPRQHLVIGLGVNREKVAPPDFDRQAFRREREVEPDELFVFAVGRLVKRKGYPVLIDAIGHLAGQGIRVKLLLAGTGPERGALESQIETTGLTHSVRLLGFLPDSELKLYLKASDMLVMPSISDDTGDTEGLGIPLLEAMANGTPVIASETGGILDVVQHEKTGLLFPMGDSHALAQAIRRMAQDSALRSQLIESGHNLVNTSFSWRSIARETLEVFSLALRGKSRPT